MRREKKGEIAQSQQQQLNPVCLLCVRSCLESSQKESSATTEEEEEESCGVLEAQVLSLSQVVRDNCAEFIKHIHGSHVVRTLLHVLAGCVGPPRTESRPGKHTHTNSQLCILQGFSRSDTVPLFSEPVSGII